MSLPRLAIVTSHPIQYYAPWFRWLAATGSLQPRVFYLWDTERKATHDPGFGREVQWDVPLLDGYDFEFVPNLSRKPCTSRFFGLRNPDLLARIRQFAPDAALLIGYRYASLFRLIFTPERSRGFPLLFRGDSHRLFQGTVDGGRRTESLGLSSGLRRRLIAAVYKRFAAVLYVGKANRDYYRRHGVPEEKLFFSPHAVDNARFIGSAEGAAEEARRWRAELGIPEQDLVVLFAGKFEAKKRPLDLLEAFSELNFPNVSLLFVGNGHLEDELKRCAKTLSKVFFAPFQNQSEMPKTYAAADLFVLPSFGPEESWGLAINEALCLRCPVIVSDHVGCGPDLVKSGANGLVFPAGDTNALAAALSRALTDPKRLREWGEEGFRMVQRYDYAHATSGLKQALAKALERAA